MIRVTTLENRFETDLITDALDQEGIEHVVKPFQDSAYDGLFVTQKGYGLLLVEESQADRAREIVAAVRESVESEEPVEVEEVEESEEEEEESE